MRLSVWVTLLSMIRLCRFHLHPYPVANESGYACTQQQYRAGFGHGLTLPVILEGIQGNIPWGGKVGDGRGR